MNITEIDKSTGTYYAKNKERIDMRESRVVQCNKCLRILQFRSMKAHIHKPKCERDYQKRMSYINAKPSDSIEVIHVI
jgi:hypothetical protein